MQDEAIARAMNSVPNETPVKKPSDVKEVVNLDSDVQHGGL